MKVSELIEKLQAMNPEASVQVRDRWGDYSHDFIVVKCNGLEFTVLIH